MSLIRIKGILIFLGISLASVFYSGLIQGQSNIDSIEDILKSLDNSHAALLNVERQLPGFLEERDYLAFDHFFELGMNYASEISADTSIAYLYSQRGNMEFQKGDFNEAKKNYLLAIEYFNYLNVNLFSDRVKLFESNVYNNLGIVNDIQGATHLALKNFHTVLNIQEELKDSLGIATIYLNIGNLYLDQERHKRAEDYYLLAMDYFERLDNKSGIATIKINLGEIATQKNELELALKENKEALSLYQEINEVDGIAFSMINISNLYLDLGMTDSAKYYMDISFDIYRVIEDSSGIAEILYVIGKYYMDTNDPSKAEMALIRSYNYSSKREMVDLQMRVAKLLSKFYSSNSDYEKAFVYLSQYRLLNNKYNTNETRRKFSVVEEEYLQESRNKEAALKELELKAVSDKLKFNQILNNLVVSGLIIIIIFIIILYIRYKREISFKNKLASKNQELYEINEEYHQTLISKKEKEILLKEIHHRVKNNLQIINSLLRFQARKSPKSVQGSFLDLQSKITAMALLHDQLYLSRDFSMIDVNTYLTQLITNLVSAYDIKENINFDVKIDVDHLDLDTLHPLGLLINEVVSNSIKYAFKGVKNKNIYLHFNQTNHEYKLQIGDKGIGFDENSSSFNSNSIGLELIFNLSEQLGGKIERTIDNGTHYCVTFKAVPA
ncbi:MAG: hypothetical protein DRI54_00275 [Bacteroidetes bacterium]|nr:MAG: hypothetical protein DRI54_00275 [Bacteroidota bacterium]